MPKIPTAGERQVANAGRAIVPLRPQSEVGASAFSNVGNEVARAAIIQERRRSQFDVAQAESAFLRGHSLTMRELEDDDYGTYADRYDKKMKETRDNAAKLIKSTEARNIFLANSEQSLIKGHDQVYAKAETKRHDLNRGTLIEGVESNREAALEADDEGTAIALLKSTHDMIDGARYQGSIDAEQAAKMRQTAAEDFALSRVKMLPYEEQVELLSKAKPDDGSLTSFIPEDKLKAQLETAKVGITIQANAAERARKAGIAQLEIDMANAIEQGGDPSKLYPAQWAQLPAAKRTSLLNYAKTKAAGTEPVTDDTVYWNLVKEATDDPASFSLRDLAEFREKLSDADWNKVIGLRDNAKADVAAQLDDYRTELSVVNGALRGMRIDPNGEGAEAEKVARFRSLVAEDLVRKKQATGKATLPTSEVEETVDRLTTKVLEPGGGLFGWFRDEKRLYELEPEEVQTLGVDDIPDSEREQIEDSLRRRGKEVTDDIVLRMFRAGLQGG